MDTKRGDDAQDHAPRPKGKPTDVASDRQDGANYEEEANSGSIDVSDVSSANDEGAN